MLDTGPFSDMKVNNVVSQEHMEVADAQNLLRVYTFLLKRARQRRLELAAENGHNPADDTALESAQDPGIDTVENHST